jgi:prevent-host-death family protein
MTKRLGAGVVRANWRDFLDAVLLKGLQIIILRHHKPVAVLLSYEKWLEMGGKEEESN